MAVKPAVHYIAACNICGAEYDDGEVGGWSDTPADAIDWVNRDEEWTAYQDDWVICPIADPAHNHARGHEPDTSVHVGPDQMAIRFPAEPAA
jgi:hypothetical protein